MKPTLSLLAAALVLLTGCDRGASGRAEPVGAAPSRRGPPIRMEPWLEDFDSRIAVFETVFWEPDDTVSLRWLIRETPLVSDKRVLEIGTGSGLISLYCLRAGARRVVATDINPAAVANLQHNVELLELPADRLEVRQVAFDRPGAFAVVGDDERYDLILSNPPWEDQSPESVDQYALYDPSFELMASLLDGLPKHLAPGGKALLAYGSVTAVRTLQQMARQRGLKVDALDDRELDSLPELFLPGMLLEVTVDETAEEGGAGPQ